MRYLVLVLALLVAVFLPAPRATDAAPLAPAVTLTETLHSGGRERTYRLVLPKGFDKAKPAPLVLALHGGGGTAEQFDRSTRGHFGREAQKRGWVVVFPQGVAKGWNDGRPLTSLRDRRRKGVDDVAFLSTLIDHLHATRGIDRTRVYATGMSNGGFMSYRLGLDLADKIAAIAPVCANLAKVHDGKRPARPVGLLAINGTKDPLVPYAGGYVKVFGRKRGAILSVDETLRRWTAFNGCTKPPTTTALADKAPKDGTRAYLVAWPACRKGARVRQIRIEGGGHTWAGGTQNLPRLLVGAMCKDFDAVPMIFAFFAKHRRVPKAPAPAKAAPKKK